MQRLLRHLVSCAITEVPQPRGLIEGRDVVAYLPGTVPQYPFPDWVWSDAVLTDAAQLLARIHCCSKTFDRTDAVWQFPDRQPSEIICHNDFAPHNLVFDEERLVGAIDWDTASPGPRAWDLSYTAYRLVPLAAPSNPDALPSTIDERRRRLALLCSAYGPEVGPEEILAALGDRLHDLAAFSDARASQLPVLHEHAQLYRTDAAWAHKHRTALGG